MKLDVFDVHKARFGTETIELAAGTVLKIKTVTGGEDTVILNEDVPNNKKWTAVLTVSITEETA